MAFISEDSWTKAAAPIGVACVDAEGVPVRSADGVFVALPAAGVLVAAPLAASLVAVGVPVSVPDATVLVAAGVVVSLPTVAVAALVAAGVSELVVVAVLATAGVSLATDVPVFGTETVGTAGDGAAPGVAQAAKTSETSTKMDKGTANFLILKKPPLEQKHVSFAKMPGKKFREGGAGKFWILGRII